MGDFTRVKSPMKIHGRFYLSKKTPDYKMTHQLFTLFWIISNILTFHFYTFSVIYTFYFYIAFEELTFYQKCSIKCVLYSLFYSQNISPQCGLDSPYLWWHLAHTWSCNDCSWITSLQCAFACVSSGFQQLYIHNCIDYIRKVFYSRIDHL